MSPTTIGGLPAHALLVHATVVLVPAAAALLVLSVLWPAARRRLGAATPVAALAALVLVPITAGAGRWLELRVPTDPALTEHAGLGAQMVYWSSAVFVLSVVWWAAHERRVGGSVARLVRGRIALPRSAVRGAAVLVVVAALVAAAGSVVHVYRVGDSGATAVWQDTV